MADEAGKDRVADDEALWRRIHPSHIHADADGRPYVTSAAFRSNQPLSLDRARVILSAGLTKRFTLGADGGGVAELLASEFRSHGLDPRPDPEPDNPAHALIEQTHINRRIVRSLAEACSLSSRQQILGVV